MYFIVGELNVCFFKIIQFLILYKSEAVGINASNRNIWNKKVCRVAFSKNQNSLSVRSALKAGMKTWKPADIQAVSLSLFLSVFSHTHHKHTDALTDTDWYFQSYCDKDLDGIFCHFQRNKGTKLIFVCISFLLRRQWVCGNSKQKQTFLNIRFHWT